MSKIGIQTHGVNHSVMRKGLKTGGRAALRFGGGRTNLLEQLGRVEAEPSNPNRRAEISRVHGELNRGYAKGGRAGFSMAGKVVRDAKKVFKRITHEVPTGPHTDVRRRELNKKWKRKEAAEGGRIGFRTGKGVVPRRSQPPHKETTIPSRLDSQRKNIRLKAEHAKAEHAKGGRIGLPSKRKDFKTHGRDVPTMAATGGRIGKKHGFQILGGGVKGKPHSTREGRDDAGRRRFKRIFGEDVGRNKGKRPRWPKGFDPKKQQDPKEWNRGRVEFKKGGTDKKWMQKVSVSIKKRGTKGKCTPITKPGCTGRAKALAKTFKKIAAKRKA